MKQVTMLLIVVLMVLSVAGCQPKYPPPPQGVDIATGKTVTTTAPDSDGIPFVGGPGLPTDTRVYHITGTVVADAQSVVRQVSPATGRMSGSSYTSDGYGSGWMSGTFSGEVLKGKTLVRLLVQSIDPSDTDWITVNAAHPDQVVVVKMTDLKGLALYPGDFVRLSCRRQAEAVAAINQDEWFNPATYTTWELDYCRMSDPVVTVKY